MCHVLIIEDEPLIAMSLQDLLESEGATSFDLAATQVEAVAAAMTRVPSFITSDVMLADGTGPDAVAIIHEHCGEVPVVFITATPGACSTSFASTTVMQKPYNRQTLEQTFRRLTGSERSDCTLCTTRRTNIAGETMQQFVNLNGR